MIGGSAPPLGLFVTRSYLLGACMLEKPFGASKNWAILGALTPNIMRNFFDKI
jgi:hypothetical protein